MESDLCVGTNNLLNSPAVWTGALLNTSWAVLLFVIVSSFFFTVHNSELDNSTIVLNMPDARRVTYVALSSILLLGTIYSVVNQTYLDTSDPLVALGSVKHPLHDHTYFARKGNILNTVFIKRAWGWTSAAFFALWLTYPTVNPTIRGGRRIGMSARERLLKWIAATFVWLVFAAWFFGPAIIDRIIAASGGECVVRLPSGKVLGVPVQYCIDRSILSPATHPELFFVPPLALPDMQSDWRTRPRMMRGHDVSGHVFLLTMSLLFLADMVRPSLALPSHLRSTAHNIALIGTGTLMVIWLFSEFVTSVYFHNPAEKFTGYSELQLFQNNTMHMLTISL